MQTYAVNLIQVIHRTIAWFLRKEINVTWFYAFVRPLNLVSIQFEDFTRQRKRQASYNGQMMVLERMLNLYYLGQDKWATASDTTASNGFYIEQASGEADEVFSWTEGETIPASPGEVFSWTEGETIPASPGEVFSWTEGELTNLTYDFKVKIPSTFTYDETEVRALVDRYKLAGKVYAIETY